MKEQQGSESKLNQHLQVFFEHRLAEKATPEYFDGMLGQVHRRLRQELVGRPRWWDRLAEFFAPSLPERRSLLVRYALPAILVAAATGIALQQDRGTSGPGQRIAGYSDAASELAAVPLPADLVRADSNLLWNLKEERKSSIVAMGTGSGDREERTTKAKDRENGGRSFVTVLPVRYEASVDF